MDTFQIFAEPSIPPDARVLPSGAKQTETTESLCPFKQRRSVPLRISHNRTVPSSPAEATSLPSGENATLNTPSTPLRGVTFHGSNLLARCRLIEFNSRIPTSNRNCLSIGGEGDRMDAKVVRHAPDDLPGSDVTPDQIYTTRDKIFSVRREGDARQNGVIILSDFYGAGYFSTRNFKKLDGFIVTPCESEYFAVGRQRRDDYETLGLDLLDLFSRRKIPEEHAVRIGSRSPASFRPVK